MLALASLCLLLSATVHVSQAINVYLSPSASYQRTILSPDDASAALSRHLGMEVFETLRDTSGTSYQEETFVGQGETSALILVLNQADAQGLLLQFRIDALLIYGIQLFCHPHSSLRSRCLCSKPTLYSPSPL